MVNTEVGEAKRNTKGVTIIKLFVGMWNAMITRESKKRPNHETAITWEKKRTRKEKQKSPIQNPNSFLAKINPRHIINTLQSHMTWRGKRNAHTKEERRDAALHILKEQGTNAVKFTRVQELRLANAKIHNTWTSNQIQHWLTWLKSPRTAFISQNRPTQLFSWKPKMAQIKESIKNMSDNSRNRAKRRKSKNLRKKFLTE